VRLADQKIGIAYGSDVEAVCAQILDVLVNHPMVTQDPPPKVGLDALDDSSLRLRVRYWVPTRQYYSARFSVMQALHKALVVAHVEIPLPQRVVRTISS